MWFSFKQVNLILTFILLIMTEDVNRVCNSASLVNKTNELEMTDRYNMMSSCDTYTPHRAFDAFSSAVSPRTYLA